MEISFFTRSRGDFLDSEPRRQAAGAGMGSYPAIFMSVPNSKVTRDVPPSPEGDFAPPSRLTPAEALVVDALLNGFIRY